MEAQGLKLVRTDNTAANDAEIRALATALLELDINGLSHEESNLYNKIKTRQLQLTANGRLWDITSTHAHKPGGDALLFDPSYPKEQTLKDVLQALHRGVIQHDWAAWAEMFDDNALYIINNREHWDGKAKIHDKIVSQTKLMPEHILEFDIDYLTVEGNMAQFCVTNRFKDRHGKELFAMQNTTTMFFKNRKIIFEEDAINYPRMIGDSLATLAINEVQSIWHFFAG